ncbi:Peroxidase, family 2-domain-containing protein [Aspergillus karnatakaensis]|uniref:peroxidase family protein n=1 Tax=Aspergillus karnatakaensis TaxID=1810916 RepID=UPI003CCCAFCD
MKLLQPVLAFATLASATPDLAHAHPHHDWKPAGPGDFRGPCPMMNTLANHNFLPHDGRNLTHPVVVDALTKALNFNATLASLMFDMAIIANPEPNATFFTLDHLNRHNVLEHDASLSRPDATPNTNSTTANLFNATIFAQTTSLWTDAVLTPAMLANSKIYRQIISKAFNPEYTFTETTEQFSLGEVAAPIIVFGDLESATVERGVIEYFFRNERLPTELGWKKKEDVVQLEDVLRISGIIAQAAGLLTGAESTATSTSTGERAGGNLKMTRDLHARVDL